MVERILTYLSVTFFLINSGENLSFAQDTQHRVGMIVSSSVFVSGDIVPLLLLPVDEAGSPVEKDKLLNLYLVDNTGKTVAIERFNASMDNASSALLLSDQLATGNYKLVAHIPGSDFQTEAIIHVYNPAIFSSTSLPKNADPELDPLKQKISDNECFKVEIKSNSVKASSKSNETELVVVKVYDPSLEASPLFGTLKESEVVVDNSPKFKLVPPVKEPNSRISVYFLDQGLVEEFAWRDSARYEDKLMHHRGASAVWAYQSGNLGEPIGEVEVDFSSLENNQFKPFEDKVPFSEAVVKILDHKRKRKYIDQIYRTGFDEYEPLAKQTEQIAPDQVYLASDYSGIATLREAFSGIVSKASVKRNKNTYELYLSPANSGFRYESGPLILVNGSPLFELGELMETPFHQIRAISIYNSIQSQKRFGVLGRYGVVSIEMKEEFQYPKKDEKENYPYYQGVNDLVQVNKRVDSALPDLRPVLLWEPKALVEPSHTFIWEPSDVAETYQLWGACLSSEGISVFCDDLSPVSN
ncbi:hypothetical protein LZF95_14105 [Algoriphagus sp. AGSA1]|uniref:hypothetical protein n=1 Tax=Algoriphagus sp. AGSA1 TaxID=2907213 RepID=UPI001F1CAA20|nr:hypothetical protein [Algoriphagus sp. AGSA1]MCE7055810.1 hypothetical protein [Algoriphagus sp. AGSA1]